MYRYQTLKNFSCQHNTPVTYSHKHATYLQYAFPSFS